VTIRERSATRVLPKHLSRTVVRHDAVVDAKPPAKQRSARRKTGGIGAVAVSEGNALFCDAIDVGTRVAVITIHSEMISPADI
jgi:hypothetical protein